MFNRLFLFSGRIRRTEYWISLIIANVFFVVITELTKSTKLTQEIAIIAAIVGYWFLLSQGAKRCHDRGNSGWYQIIPFYIFWMLFADSTPGFNVYGENPKGIGND